MKFEDTHVFRDERYCLGVESTSERYYASIPVSNGLVDYDEYYELTADQYNNFVTDHDAAMEFIEACRRHELDRLLLEQPGSRRGSPL
jgi:hypothetical protein